MSYSLTWYRLLVGGVSTFAGFIKLNYCVLWFFDSLLLSLRGDSLIGCSPEFGPCELCGGLMPIENARSCWRLIYSSPDVWLSDSNLCLRYEPIRFYLESEDLRTFNWVSEAIFVVGLSRYISVPCCMLFLSITPSYGDRAIFAGSIESTSLPLLFLR